MITFNFPSTFVPVVGLVFSAIAMARWPRSTKS